jgi:HAE1 family hydrophobic/amphiphilic exporter-1
MMVTVGMPGDMGDVTRTTQELVKPAVERVGGVAGVSISGGASRVISVEYDHESLVESGLSPFLLQQLITFQNLSVPAGVIVEDGVRYQTRVGAKFTSADEIADLAIGLKTPSESPEGIGGFLGLSFFMPTFLTIGDVAKVEETFEEAEGYTRVNGKPAVVMNIYKQSGENTVTVARQVREAMARLAEERSDIEIEYVFDQSTFITNSINNLAENAGLGALLAVAVLFLFLRHVGSTLLVGVSIPLSIIFTFVMMYAFNLTINLLTLGGLALGVGMLVDNSIVVLENIFRRQELGDSPHSAAIEGTREVSRAIIASTLTTVAVFIPVVFIQSMAGHIFRDLAMTITFSLLASLAVALTVLPLMASYFVRVSDSYVERAKRDADRKESLGGIYDRMLNWAMSKRWLVLGAIAVVLVVAIFTFPRLGMQLLKPMDMGRVDISLRLPPGTPVEATNEVALRLEKELMELAGVESITAQVGSSGSGDFVAMASDGSANQASLAVKLLREGKTIVPLAKAGAEMRRVLGEIRTDYPDLQYSVDTSGYGALTGGSSDYLSNNITLEVCGTDPREISDYTDRIVERLRQEPGLVEVASSSRETQPVILLDVNRTRALMGGLTVGQIGLGVRTGMFGSTVTYVERDGELIPVIVRPASEGVPSLETVLDMPVTSTISTGSFLEGASGLGSNVSAAARTASSSIPTMLAPSDEVLVGRVVTPEVVEGPITISRRNGRRYGTVQIAFEGMKQSRAGELALSAAHEVEAPEGYSVELAGTTRVINEAFSDLSLAGWIAVVLVYMVMAIQYESLLYPLIVMFTLPLAGIGAIGFLAITGESVSITAIIGLIILAGIVVNNGIVLVDFINQLKARGMTTSEAVRKAGRARLRPILMTALTTILGLVPLAIGHGAGSELQQPLAITVIGGLATATFLTLFVIPIVYELMDELAQKLSRKGGTVIEG